MSGAETLYLEFVLGAFSIFAMAVGYQSWAESRALTKKTEG